MISLKTHKSDLLQSALNPQSVAVVGASENIHKMGGRPIHYMLRQGFKGRLYPVNPARGELQGLKSYPSLAALPEVPDLVLVIVAGEAAVNAVDECAALGVKSVIVIASGFGETGEAGLKIQNAMADKARAAGMRLFGPNTQGLANFGNGVVTSFSTMFTEVQPADGPIAVVSQSGGMSAMLYGLLRGRGLGVRHVHATGNEADVSVAELAWAVAHDPDVKLLALYMESLGNAELLARTAAYARSRDLPIVAIKAGRSVSGQKAASSHTGSLASEDRVVDAFFRRHGICRVRDPQALVLSAEGYLKGWRPAGRRLVAISNSGASCVMAADFSEELNLPLAVLDETTKIEVAQKLPGFATATNPIDITAALLTNSRLFSDILPVLAKDKNADLYLVSIPVAGVGYDLEAIAGDAADFAELTGKPVAVAAWQETVAAPFRAHGLATFATEAEALGVLELVATHAELLRAPNAVWPHQDSPVLPSGDAPFLNESESLAVLASAGIPVVAHRLCTSAQDARDAFNTLGAPVVVKACSKDVPHKSEHGLVALNVKSGDEVATLFDAQWATLAMLGASRDGVLVASMRKGLYEFMVGARVDVNVGPVVVVGGGGKYVEALDDIALLVPPFNVAEVKFALGKLHIAPLYAGVRGDAAMDIDALAAIVVQVGKLIVAAEGAIRSMDLNPVLVGPAGQGAVVVDALIERGG
jgi:acyl-CoA synthetase (NDP forming)